MSQVPHSGREPPALGERRARWGYGYQDKVATERILKILRDELRTGGTTFQGVRLADLDAGRVDDFVLVWDKEVEGNSIKWSGEPTPINWGELIGANGLLKELAEGYQRLKDRWPGRIIFVRLQSNRPASTEKHQRQLISTFSVAELLTDHWSSGPTPHDSAEVTAMWSKISEHLGLANANLLEFVKSCQSSLGHSQPPGSGPDSQDWRHYKKQFDMLHKAIATWLTNNPDKDFIDRDFLLSAIGFRKNRSGLIQRFPPPRIPYSRNEESADQLTQLIDRTEGGYIAVVGPAGVGKSTLVQDVLSGPKYPFFIPYYAFLPDTDGNRDRGEALTFFQDVVGRLDKFFTHRYSLGISDVAQGREALREHMCEANRQYIVQGHKTILLIDGLDHVTREINLQNPLLQELPDPAEVPDGFLIILSSQPQALTPGTIAPQIASYVSRESDRRITVSGLTRPEVHAILARADKVTTGTERDALYNACLGNPLILCYLIHILERTTVEEAIELAGNYAGDIDEYYQSRLVVPLQDAQTRQLLGLLCRAAPTIPVKWLQEDWPEWVQIDDIYTRILAPFAQSEEGNLQFIHNSLVAFLKSETRSKIPGADPYADERRFHSILADRCGNRPCVDPLSRARVLHLLRANRYSDLLCTLSSDWLRQAIEAFLPFALIRPLLLSGWEAAWNLGEVGQVLRLVLLDYELDQRSSRLEAGDLAEKFLSLDRPELAISQIRAVGRLLVEDDVALGFAHSLWLYADEHNLPDLKNAARILYLQAEPVSLLHQNEPIHTLQYASVLRAWSVAAPLFDGCRSVIAKIKKLRFEVYERREELEETAVKTDLLYSALVTVTDLGSGVDDYRLLLDEIAELGQKTWRFAALIKVARRHLRQLPFETLAAAYGESERNDDINLAYAELLFDQGHASESGEIIRHLAHIRFDRIQNQLSDITYTVRLRFLQELLTIPEGSVPNVNDYGEEAYARIETTTRRIGVLLARAKRDGSIADLNATLRSLLLFHHRAVTFPEYDWRNNYVVTQSKRAIYREIVRLAAALGVKGLECLRDVLFELMNGSADDQFAAPHRRYFAEELFRYRVLSKEQAVKLGLSSTHDINDEDPMERQAACFEIAIFLHTVGEDTLAAEWTKRAGKVSAGAGSHKDYHMSYLADWISRSVGDSLDADKLSMLEKFARPVEVAGGDGGSQAATNVLQLLLRLAPIRASRFAVELVDRDIADLSETLEALMLGGAKAGASTQLLAAMYGELLSLISLSSTSEVAVEILRRFPIEKRIAAAKALMNSVRTNSLPSNRIEIARAAQDALRHDGLGECCLTGGLKQGRDDTSTKNWLYRRPTGEMETIDQVAARLSDHDHSKEWNPNPAENAEYDWWSAVKRAKTRDISHLNDLLGSFPPSEHRKVDLLAWKSERLLEMGDRNTARLLAEQAIQSARDGSWIRWLDGAQKRVAYGALKRIDASEALSLARAQFARDLTSGKIGSYSVLAGIAETIDFLEFEWPSEAVCKAIDDYLDQVLAANQEVSPFESMILDSEECPVDEALCRFLVHLLAFPVVDVGVAARRALSRYVNTDGAGLVALVAGKPCWESVQLEHLLASLHVGSHGNSHILNRLRNWILGLNKHESIAVRGIARRICEEQGWPWMEINNQAKQPVILLPRSLASPANYQEVRMLVGGDADRAFLLHRDIFTKLEGTGLDATELRSAFLRSFEEIERDYSWENRDRLQRWIRRVRARHWLQPRAIVGREAAMRVLGRLSLSGQAPPGAEQGYDYLYPIYDPRLELVQPVERPVELHGMDWELWDDRGKAWFRGEKADSWADYPESVDGLHIIGERTWLIRPDWEWPREERRRGLIIGRYNPHQSQECLGTSRELTYEGYLRGEAQGQDQLIVLNSERQLVGPAYRWAAINSAFAKRLGWRPSSDEPFKWADCSGNLMVKSVYWKDGWIWLEPPRFEESLGEGWLVLCTQQALQSIREASDEAELHLWVERHSYGEKAYSGKWHLSRSL